MQNGRISPDLLVSLSTNGKLLAAPAKSYERLNKAFKAEFGKPLAVTDAYRAYDNPYAYSQTDIFLKRYDHTPRAGNTYANGGIKTWNGKTWHKKSGVAVAATPGTSNHGLGITIDFGAGVNTSFTSKEYLWMKANAPAYGWTNDEGRQINEPWHWNYTESNDKHRNDKESPTVTYFSKGTTKTKQKFGTSFKQVVVDDNKTDVSVVWGKDGLFDSRFKATVSGLKAGSQIQIRAVRYEKDKNGKYVVNHTFPTVERIGTSGLTMIDAEQIGKVKSNQRIRWQVSAGHADVVLDSVTVQSFVHEN